MARSAAQMEKLEREGRRSDKEQQRMCDNAIKQMEEFWRQMVDTHELIKRILDIEVNCLNELVTNDAPKRMIHVAKFGVEMKKPNGFINAQDLSVAERLDRR